MFEILTPETWGTTRLSCFPHAVEHPCSVAPEMMKLMTGWAAWKKSIPEHRGLECNILENRRDKEQGSYSVAEGNDEEPDGERGGKLAR